MWRRGPQTAVHPGQQCGPCHLCGQSSAYYTHTLAWEEIIKKRPYQLESVDDHSCICKACEKDIKRHIMAEDYHPCGRPKAADHVSCIVAACNSTAIIPTGLVTAQQIAELLQTPVPETTAGQLTPLCQTHYKQVHRLLHVTDDMYKHPKCYTCNAILKEPTRLSPNPSTYCDVDIQITGADVICTNCYNIHAM